MKETANLLLGSAGLSLAGAATLAAILSFKPRRHSYHNRVLHSLWRYFLPALLFEDGIFPIWIGRFYP